MCALLAKVVIKEPRQYHAVANLLSSKLHNFKQVEFIGDLFLLAAVMFYSFVVAVQQGLDALMISGRLRSFRDISALAQPKKFFQKPGNLSRTWGSTIL